MVEISFYSPHPRPLPKGARELLFPMRCLEAALAIALNVYPALRLRLTQDAGTFTLNLTVHLWSWNMVILALSGLVTAILVGYVIVENLMEAAG